MSNHSAQAMLWKAIDEGDISGMLMGLVMGANPNGVDERKRNALHRAMDANLGENVLPQMLETLVNHGGDIFSVDPGNGRNLLVKAALMGSEKLVWVFADKGLPLSQADHQGTTALIAAASIGAKSVCQNILTFSHNNAALLGARDAMGQTALIAGAHHPDTALILLAAGADPRPRDRQGRSAMDLCTDSAVRTMMKAKASVLEAQAAQRQQLSQENAAELQNVMAMAQRISSTLVGPKTAPSTKTTPSPKS